MAIPGNGGNAEGGGIYIVNGELNLAYLAPVSSNTATGGTGGSGEDIGGWGGDSEGGGVYAGGDAGSASVFANRSPITGNIARGGDGGGDGGDALGGGVYFGCGSTLDIVGPAIYSPITGNTVTAGIGGNNGGSDGMADGPDVYWEVCIPIFS